MKDLIKWEIDRQDELELIIGKRTFDRMDERKYNCKETGQILYLCEGMEIFTREFHIRNTKRLSQKQLEHKVWLAINNNKGRLKKWRIETRFVGGLPGMSGTKHLAMVGRNKEERILNLFNWPAVIFTSQ